MGEGDDPRERERVNNICVRVLQEKGDECGPSWVLARAWCTTGSDVETCPILTRIHPDWKLIKYRTENFIPESWNREKVGENGSHGLTFDYLDKSNARFRMLPGSKRHICYAWICVFSGGTFEWFKTLFHCWNKFLWNIILLIRRRTP